MRKVAISTGKWARRSDKHHATLLVALNTSWKGGDLVLRRNGIETHVDLRPQFDDEDLTLQVVAFFTDTEHPRRACHGGNPH